MDGSQLLLCDEIEALLCAGLFLCVISEVIMDYISTEQAAEKWGITPQRVRQLCKQNRIEGLSQVGKTYLIPSLALKPKDARIKTGKFIKTLKD